ncbi:ATP-dependent Clp protease proteolytic subunit [Irregularibacter muris]|uniref:ATP-dependent Clp protease proteolytic subunit n=1 Tax=Irregularibacter muris TaxID=1796619 RepID=A0AAE3L223_9FIRM|nr:NfeD family protein [Irregularibacter muris]MCR1897854.1 ATP-dependent Clp protease proteolytic subunit [Irregularibacter muris]
MKKWIPMVLSIFLIIIFIGAKDVQAADSKVYVIPIKGEVGNAMEKFVQEGIKEAETNGGSAIIFDIDTPGGQVDKAVNISEAILDSTIPTIAYVNGEAISAGTIITISAEKIIMSPRATIGAAETRPNEEKYISYWTGKLRNVAQIRDRDPMLVAAMADANIEIPNVVAKGKLLTLTTQEAMELHFIDGVEDSIQGVMQESGLAKQQLKELSPSFQLRLASLTTSVAATSLLLTVGFIGMIIELLTPGFGLGGGISLVAFGLYFGGVLLAGYSTGMIMVLFLLGLVFLLVEIFVPGFGIPGILGMILLVSSIIMASSSLEQAIISLIITAILTLIAFFVLIKFMPKNKFFDKLTLPTSLDTVSGYVGSENFKEYKDKTGVSVTPLRPSGSILVEGRKLDAVSENAFIEKGEKIHIIKTEGRRIIVRKID